MARISLWHLLCARYYVKTSICIISFNQINILLRKYYYYCYFTELGFREVKEFAQGHKLVRERVWKLSGPGGSVLNY